MGTQSTWGSPFCLPPSSTLFSFPRIWPMSRGKMEALLNRSYIGDHLILTRTVFLTLLTLMMTMMAYQMKKMMMMTMMMGMIYQMMKMKMMIMMDFPIASMMMMIMMVLQMLKMMMMIMMALMMMRKSVDPVHSLLASAMEQHGDASS